MSKKRTVGNFGVEHAGDSTEGVMCSVRGEQIPVLLGTKLKEDQTSRKPIDDGK